MCHQDVPPDGERLYAILREALQRRRDAEWPSLDRLPEPCAPGAHPLTEAPHKRNAPVAEHGRGAGANHMTARGIPRDEPSKKYRPSEPRDYRPGEWEAVDRLLDEATKAGLFFMLPLDNLLDVMELWTERAPLRADLTEHATATTFGLCFVPVKKQHPVVPPKGHLVVRLTPEGGGEELPTVLVSVETGTILQAKTMRAVISTSPETMQKFASLGRVLLVFILMCEKGIPLPRSIGKLARDNEATR